MYRMLLVEDDPRDAALMIEALRECRIETDLQVVQDGSKALEMLQCNTASDSGWRPDLVVCDLHGAGISGHDLLRIMKSDALFRKIPVVIMSASSAPIVVNLSYELQANCYIQKPSSFNDLCAVVRSLYDFWFSTVVLPQR